MVNLRALLLALAFLLLPLPTRAATEVTLGGAFSARIEPANPSPNSTFEIAISSLSTDLSRATITWQINGRQVEKGTGITRLSSTMSAAGTKTVVTITALPPEGGTLQKIITIIPAELELFWEANTVAPALYRGKKLPSSSSELQLTGFFEGKNASGKTLTNDDIIFTWNQDGKDLPALSGQGKFRATIALPGAGDSTTIKLLAATSDNTVVAERVVEIPIVAPFALFREEKPLEGLSPNALSDTLLLGDDEITLRADAYFFSEPSSALTYSWAIGNRAINVDESNPRIVTLRQIEGGGRAQLTLGVRHTTKLFQQAISRLVILFNRTGNTNSLE